MSTKETETQNLEKGSSEEVIQQTNEPQNQPTSFDPKYVASLEERIAEQQIQNRRLEKLVEGVRTSRKEETPAPKVRNIEDERKKFYEDPVGSLDSQLNARDEKILRQMSEMLEPIRQVASSFGVDNEYKRIKNQLRQDRNFGKALRDPEIESIVDNIMTSGAVEITEDSVRSAIAQVVGARTLSGVGINAGNNRETRTDPPNIPPTRTRVDGTAPKKELTEEDRIAMKIAGLRPGNPEHEKEYWNLIDDETMTLQVHKKK